MILWKGTGIMRVAQEQVECFMEMIGDPVEPGPTVADIPDGVRRFRLMEEELHEYRTALVRGDLVAIADALGDLLYTVLGTASHHGISLEPIHNEIHRSNMTKTPTDHPTKKCKKGDGYSPPNLAPLLLLMSPSFEEVR